GDANNERTELLIKGSRIELELLPLCEKKNDSYVKTACVAALNMLSARYVAAGREDDFLIRSGLRPEYQKALSDQMSMIISQKDHADEVKEIKRQATAIKDVLR